MMLTFRLGTIPVHVQFFFFLTALLLSGGLEGSPAVLVGWVMLVFVSVLLHELGHAIAGRLFGLDPVITLHGMGGTTSWSGSRRTSPLGQGARMVIAFAGPFAGLCVGGIL